jgi:hypothetical protein
MILLPIQIHLLNIENPKIFKSSSSPENGADLASQLYTKRH